MSNNNPTPSPASCSLQNKNSHILPILMYFPSRNSICTITKEKSPVINNIKTKGRPSYIQGGNLVSKTEISINNKIKNFSSEK